MGPKLCSSAIPNICLAAASAERRSVVTSPELLGHEDEIYMTSVESAGRWVIDDPPSCLWSCSPSSSLSQDFSILHDRSRGQRRPHALLIMFELRSHATNSLHRMCKCFRLKLKGCVDGQRCSYVSRWTTSIPEGCVCGKKKNNWMETDSLFQHVICLTTLTPTLPVFLSHIYQSRGGQTEVNQRNRQTD